MNLNKVIKNLSEKAIEDIDSDIYYLSVYASSDENTKVELKQKLKSRVLETLKENLVSHETNRLRLKLVEEITKSVRSLDYIPEGIAIFAKIDESRGGSYDNLRIVKLNKKPRDEAYIGKVYKIDQLNRSKRLQKTAIVLKLEQEFCDIYLFSNNNLNKLKTIENEYITDRENEYMQVYSPTSDYQTFHGTGSKNQERSENKKTQHFLNDIAESLKIIKQNKKFNQILVFYSQAYSDNIKKWTEKLNYQYPKTEVITLDQNIKDKNLIEQRSRGIINSLQITKNKKSLESSRENHKLHIRGWNKVTKASRNYNVEKLYISSESEKAGYILNTLLYSYPVKNSKKVKDITPWIVNSTLKNGGEVIYIKDKSLLPQNNIEAKLRY